MLTRIALASAACLLLVAPVRAGDEDPAKTLTIGDKAPAIDIAHWLTPVVDGDESGPRAVSEFEAGKIYVLEFWATWCGPCLASMPHLGELQEKFAEYDVQIIGVSDEPLSTVVGFLCKTDKKSEKLWYDVVKHTLTTDPDKSAHTDYMRAAAQQGIPTAFIIGKSSQVEWIGHPMGMDAVLEKVVHGTWDRAAYQVEFEKEMAAEREMQKEQEKLYTAMDRGDWNTVISLLDAMIEKHPDNPGPKMQKFGILLTEMNEAERAYAVGRELMQSSADDPGMLNYMAWMVATEPGIKDRDLGFALMAAEKANSMTGSADPSIIDTLARVYYEKGDFANAVEWQRKAAALVGDDEMGQEIRRMLEQYEKEADKR